MIPMLGPAILTSCLGVLPCVMLSGEAGPSAPAKALQLDADEEDLFMDDDDDDEEEENNMDALAAGVDTTHLQDRRE